MRKIADIKIKNSNAIRLMICDKGKNGVFVFGYLTKKDSSCSWDAHYSDIEDAYEMGESYGIEKSQWIEIEETQQFCQDDWINPVRIIGKNIGKPQSGKFEKLVNGKWKELKTN